MVYAYSINTNSTSCCYGRLRLVSCRHGALRLSDNGQPQYLITLQRRRLRSVIRCVRYSARLWQDMDPYGGAVGYDHLLFDIPMASLVAMEHVGLLWADSQLQREGGSASYGHGSR